MSITKRIGFYQERQPLERCLQDPQFAESWQEKLRLADALLQDTIFYDQEWDMEREFRPVTFADGRFDWNHEPFGDPEWTYMLNRHRFFVLLMEVYLYTKDRRYAEKMLALWEDWIERETLVAEHLWTGWRTIETGIRLKNWVKTLNLLELCPEIELSAGLTEKIATSMNQQTDYLCQEKLINMSMISNWKVLEQNGVWLACALYPQWIDNAAEKLAIAEKVLTTSAELQVMPDGFHWEQSFMYHHEVWIGLAEVQQIAQRNGLQLPSAISEALIRMTKASVALTRPDRSQSPYGDSDVEDMRPMLQWMALVTGDPEANWLAGRRLFLSTLFDYGEAAVAGLSELNALRPQQLDQNFEDSGLVFLRDSWEKDASWTLIKNGSQGGGHGHSDNLHFELFHRESLLCDNGRFTYVEDSPIRKAFKNASAHNTILVDGEEFTRQSGSWGYEGTAPALPNYLRSRNDYAYAECSHTGYFRYGKNVLLTRKILHLKPGIWIVADEAVTNEDHEYTQLFHFPKAGRLQITEDHAVYQGDESRLHLYPLSGQQMTAAASEYSPHYNERLASEKIQLTTQGSGRSVMVTVLALEQTAITRVAVSSSGKELPSTDATALKLENAQASYTILLNHFEDATIMSRKADKLDGRFVYGRAVVVEDQQVTLLRN